MDDGDHSLVMATRPYSKMFKIIYFSPGSTQPVYHIIDIQAHSEAELPFDFKVGWPTLY